GAEGGEGRAGSLEHQVARRGHDAGTRAAHALFPDRFTLHRIPGQEVGATTFELRRRHLRLFADVDGQELVAHAGTCFGHQRETAVVGGDVHQAGVRAEGHRVPAVRTAGGGHDMEAAVTEGAVVGIGVEDGAPVFVEAGHPVGGRYEQVRRQHAAGGRFDHIEDPVLGRLHQYVLVLAVDHQVGGDDLLGIVEVPAVHRCGLVVPAVFAG